MASTRPGPETRRSRASLDHVSAVGLRKDRSICQALGTNPSELEKILDKSRQTITRYIEEDKLFTLEDTIKVATVKIDDGVRRARVIRELTDKWFSETLRLTKDTDVYRFSVYCIIGMHIHREVATNMIFDDFLRTILADETKFVLFICRPGREHAQLSRWLAAFLQQKNGSASYAILPCKLVELTPIQVLVEPWSPEPRMLHVLGNSLFVDETAQRALQMATALIDYGLSRRACIERDYGEIVKSLNNSPYDNRDVGTPVSGGPPPANDDQLDRGLSQMTGALTHG